MASTSKNSNTSRLTTRERETLYRVYKDYLSDSNDAAERVQKVSLAFQIQNIIIAERILDLTWDFDNETIYWIGAQPFNVTRLIATRENGYWYAVNEFQAAEHGGTHLDAPYHFDENGWKVADIPIERFFPNAVVLDFSREVASAGPDYIPDPKILEEKLKSLEPISNNTVLLLRFGWSKYWPNKKEYLGLDGQGILHFPGLDNTTATIISNYGKFVGVGMDTASADAGMNQNYEAHRILLGKSLYFLENTKMTEILPDKDFRLVVAPMKLKEGTGGPVRIFALLKDN